MTDMTGMEDDFMSQEMTDDDIIELTDIVEDDSMAGSEDDIIELVEIVDSQKDDSEPDMTAPAVEQPLPDVSPEALETALERVIEKKFGEKIDGMILQVMENVIEQEINQIKDRLKNEFDLMRSE